MAAFAVLVLLVHPPFAQLTFVLAVLFAAVNKTSRWRLWWLAVLVAAGLGWDAGDRAEGGRLLDSPPGPPNILAYLSGG